jgi:NADH-quinone oxidoreductase subunit B
MGMMQPKNEQGEVLVTRKADVESWIKKLLNKGQPAVNWARKNSLFQYPFVTACCGMEFMSVSCSRYDIARFGAEFPRFSPRQADLLIVVGTVVQKQAPVLRRVWEQMADPKWVIAFGACASTGGFYQNYAVVDGIDQIIPVDVYIPGCPPRPEQVLDGLMMLQEKITREPTRANNSVIG